MELTIDGRRVSYIDEGDGPVVLLLHGWGARAETYRLLINHLRGYCRVVAPDLPGFGDSDEPPVPWTVDDYVEFVARFARALGITEAVTIGHSNGGRILIKLLSRDPCPLTVRKAVLLDAAGIPAKHGAGYYLRVYSYKAFKKVMNTRPMRALCPHAIEQAQQKLGSADYRQASPLMRQTMSLALREDLTPCLPSIRASTLLIWGEQDDATPLSDGRRMEQRIPDAGLVVLEGAGHFAFAERFPQCAAVLDSFLKSTE